MSKDTGGSAFPFHGSMGEVAWEGMSLRDYFIAHAPAEPQPWFEPVMDAPRPANRFVSDNGRTEYVDERAADKAEGEFGWHNPNAEAQRLWDKEKAKQRYVQWPAAWADEQLKARVL